MIAEFSEVYKVKLKHMQSIIGRLQLNLPHLFVYQEERLLGVW